MITALPAGKDVLASLFRWVPLEVLRRLTPRPLVTLVYHAVSDDPLPHLQHLYPCKGRDAFERDLVYLKRHYRPVSHEDVLAHRRQARSLPENAVALTFDDGFAECFSVIRPLLQKHGVPATFFVVTSCIDNRALMFRNKVSLCFERLGMIGSGEAPELLARFRDRFDRRFENVGALRAWLDALQFEDTDRIDAACALLGIDVPALLREVRPFLSRDQILQLHGEGFTIGAHSCNHPRLDRMDWPDARREIEDSCRAVRDLTGRDEVPFAIPFAGLRLDRNALAALLRERPFISLVYDSNDLMKDRDFIVNRVWCDTPYFAGPTRSNLPFLLQRAHGLEPLRAIRRRLRSVGQQGSATQPALRG